MEDLAHPPGGGKVKLVLLGILLPLGLAWLAADDWTSEQAYIPGGRGGGITVHGDAARAVACCLGFAALFAHARWFWGLLNLYGTWKVLTVLSLIGLLCSMAAALCFSW